MTNSILKREIPMQRLPEDYPFESPGIQTIQDPQGGFSNPVNVNDGDAVFHSDTQTLDTQGSNSNQPSSNFTILNERFNGYLCCPKSFDAATSLEKWLIRAIIACVIIIFISYITFIVILKSAGSPARKEYAKNPSVCQTPQCVQAAGNILENLNEKVSPCDNFYEFSCGNWNNRHPLPENKHRWDTFALALEQIHFRIKKSLDKRPSMSEPKAIKSLRTAYEACLNDTAWETEGIKPLFDSIEEFDDLPMITPGWEPYSFDMMELVAQLRREYDEEFLVAVYVIPDIKNSSNFALHIGPGSLPTNKFLLATNNSMDAYLHQIRLKAVAELLTEEAIKRNKKRIQDYMELDEFLLPDGSYLFYNPEEPVPPMPTTTSKPKSSKSSKSSKSKSSGSKGSSSSGTHSTSKGEADQLEFSHHDSVNIEHFDNLVKNNPELVNSFVENNQEHVNNLHIFDPEREKNKEKVKNESDDDLALVDKEYLKHEIVMDKDIKDMWNFYVKLARIMINTPDDNTEEKKYHPVEVKDLNSLTDGLGMNIHWRSFLVDVMSETNIKITDDTRVIVSHPEYFQKLSILLKETNPRIVVNSIIFQVIFNMGMEVSGIQSRTSGSSGSSFLGRYETRAWYDCTQKMNSLMGLAMGRMYYDSNKEHMEESIEYMTNFINTLKKSLENSIGVESWLDKETKAEALKKIAALQPVIGFPKEYLDNKVLDEVYKNLPRMSKTKHFSNIRRLLEFKSQESLSKFQKQPSRKEFLSSPLSVNSFYGIQRNNIQIPMGILMPPFYQKGAIEALKYGSTGSIISHELFHGFDVKGRRWDSFGNRNDWWTKDSLLEYMKRAACFLEQYQNLPLTYQVLDGHGRPIKISSSKSLPENIADSEGIRLSWKAFQNSKKQSNNATSLVGLEKYSDEQLFFISYAQMWCSNYSPEGMRRSLLFDVHAPHPSRVNGAVRNNEDFGRVFNCSRSSLMMSDKICKIW